MKLCVFPNDPLKSYFEKGEIKERYYNPENIFDEIHVISLVESDIEESESQILFGNAKIKIHSIGKIGIKTRKNNVDKILQLVNEIKPDIIRAYNPYIEGWLAATCAKKLQIPFYLSLHTQYDFNRKIARKNNLKKYFALKYTEKFIEPFVLENADKITVVYKIIEPYVQKYSSKNVEVLHNKIDLERFSNGIKKESFPNSLIISVGSLISVKNHQCLIDAMKNIDAHLLIIGNGDLYEDLQESIKKQNLNNKITILKSVNHNEIQNYYKSAEIFALAYNPEVESLPMPVIEAMASGLPVVIPFPKEGFSEGLEEIAIFSNLNSDSFEENIKKLLDNHDLRNNLSIKSQNKAKEFDSKIIESREAQIYLELSKGN